MRLMNGNLWLAVQVTMVIFRDIRGKQKQIYCYWDGGLVFLKIFCGIINELGLLYQNNEFCGNFRNNVKVILTYSTSYLTCG